MSKPTIFKFGGTSLQTAERLNQVVDLIAEFDQPLVVVTSALGGITNLLVEICNHPELLDEHKQTIYHNHLKMLRELALSASVLSEFETHLDDTLQDLTLGDGPVTKQQRDQILSIGERLSTYLLARTLETRDLGSAYLDSRKVIRTDSTWGDARIDLAVTRDQAREAIRPLLKAGTIPVVTGFLASNEKGETTTIGRNGSDLTATILGSCLEAREVWIWTDVDGIFTADPRYHRGARILSEISFREAAEAAFFGASVIHPHTLWPVLETDVSVRVKNTLNPPNPGTLICREPENRGNVLITTSVDNVSVITVGGYGMVGVPGIAATIFSAVKETGTNVLMISQSSAEHNITFVIRDHDVEATIAALEYALSEWIEKDHRIDRVRVVSDVAIVTVVGENMRGRYGIAGTVFSALGKSKINVIAIAQGSSEYSISMVLKLDDMRHAVDVIHGELDDNGN
jgi:aspartate kinase